MQSTNGHSPRKAILYARVSTEEQARSGYSLAQQLEALREYAAHEGYEVVEEVQDSGQSGASLARPGMDRVRDLVAAGRVSVVLAQERDRFSRVPAYNYLLKQEFEKYDCKLRALNDRGDDTPEGQLTDDILDTLAKFERAKTAERTRRGKLRKAREGKIVATFSSDYGFDYNDTRDNYVVNEQAMRTVQRIFHMVGVENRSLYAVRKTLEEEHVPAPSGRRTWNGPSIRNIIKDEVYKQHTFEEITQLVSPEVASRLDQGEVYGVFWFNKTRRTAEQVTETGPNGRIYKRKTKTVHKPREEWIAVPVPDSGVPREWFDAAQETIKDNVRTSSVGSKFWELSGGVLRCSLCGGRMNPNSVARGGTRYFYYRCNKRWQDGTCEHNKSYQAERLERLVWEFVSPLLKDPDRIRRGLESMIEEERQGLHAEPEQEAKAWREQLAKVDKMRGGYQELTAKGLMTFDELGAKLRELEDTRRLAQDKLEELQSRLVSLQDLERDGAALLESYASATQAALDAATPEERHRIYKMLRLRCEVAPDGPPKLTGAITGELEVCGLESRPDGLLVQDPPRAMAALRASSATTL